MMRSPSLFAFSLVTALGFASGAVAQTSSAAMDQPSIEMNQDVLRALSSDGRSAGDATSVNTNTSSDGTLVPAAPSAIPEGSRSTTITTVRPRLIWVKGPEGKQVELKPDPKPRKKKAKKPAAAGAKKQCPCPGDAASQAAPVEPVKVVEPTPPAPPPPPPPPPPSPAATPPAPPAPVAPPPPPPPPPAAEAPPPPPPPPAPAATPPAPPAPPAPPPPPPAAPAAAAPAPAPAVAVPPPPAPPAAATPAAPAPAPTAAPAAAPAPAPAAPAAPAAEAPKGPPALSMVFKSTETTLPLTMKEGMDQLVVRLKADEALRVNLVAYASAAADQASTARRVSLSRALSVRAYLIDNGINNMRINVQAEGDKNPGGDPDRVDVFVAK